MWSEIAFVTAAYLLGAAPQLALLARLRRVRLQGDYHEGLWNTAGKLVGVAGVLGEFVKGALPVLAGRWLDFSTTTVVFGGVAAVCGQMWPVFHRFDGEKGNSIGIAMVTALNYKAGLTALVFPVAAIIIRTAPRLKAKSGGERKIVGGEYSRALPVGMALFFLAQPLLNLAFGAPPAMVWGTAAVFLLIIARRLTAGLTGDLKASREVKNILVKRLLYDRPTAR
jgi:glycerol-3-phosphate acyltransferase PlsY